MYGYVANMILNLEVKGLFQHIRVTVGSISLSKLTYTHDTGILCCSDWGNITANPFLEKGDVYTCINIMTKDGLFHPLSRFVLEAMKANGEPSPAKIVCVIIMTIQMDF